MGSVSTKKEQWAKALLALPLRLRLPGEELNRRGFKWVLVLCDDVRPAESRPRTGAIADFERKCIRGGRIATVNRQQPRRRYQSSPRTDGSQGGGTQLKGRGRFCSHSSSSV